MYGLGTIINAAGIVAGSLIGIAFGRFLKERHRETLSTACGISVIFIGIAGAMEGMLAVSKEGLTGRNSMLVVVALVLGGLIGEIINIDGLVERFGRWLRKKSGREDDAGFLTGFITASLTVSIGAMAIVGALEDGINGDWSILAIKSVLDFIIVMALAGSYGIGTAFSAIPVLMIQGLFTLLAAVIRPILTDGAMGYLSMIGSIIIFCVGLNLIRDKKIRVANFVPALIIAVAAALLGF
ncbi:MAG: DUF554 domain-containing protein [Lachnospiraceae bacterium]|nr:DUF554 domain-containing protein [Lachnospiraceae bacterium]